MVVGADSYTCGVPQTKGLNVTITKNADEADAQSKAATANVVRIGRS